MGALTAKRRYKQGPPEDREAEDALAFARRRYWVRVFAMEQAVKRAYVARWCPWSTEGPTR